MGKRYFFSMSGQMRAGEESRVLCPMAPYVLLVPCSQNMPVFPLWAHTVPKAGRATPILAAETLPTLKPPAQISPVRSQVTCIQPVRLFCLFLGDSWTMVICTLSAYHSCRAGVIS